VIHDAVTGKFLCDITEDGQEHILLEGGKGGLGNWHFRSSTNQTPRYAQPGEQGIEKTIVLQLKILADVGLVGFPNVGKSTLLSVVSAAKPEIADYPFTTLVPNLGVVSYRDNLSFVMADIPGIIEGASEGKGLGLRFLRHIERNVILLFMIPADSPDIKEEYRILLNELETYNPDLARKPRLLAITKSDMLDKELMEHMQAELPQDIQSVFISSVSGLGITTLKDMLWEEINKESNQLIELEHQPLFEPSSLRDKDDGGNDRDGDEDSDEIEITDKEDFFKDDDEHDEDDFGQFEDIGWDS
jgi:GTP-binding protein